jgi:flagellar biogenesis protein FliO
MTTETVTLRPNASAMWLRTRAVWEWIAQKSRKAPHRLRLAESLSLGERRFVAVIQFERSRFLLGGTPSSLVLLTRLEDAAGNEKEAPGRPQPASPGGLD